MKLSEKAFRLQVKNILNKLNAGKTISRREQDIISAHEAKTAPELTLEEVATHFGVSRPAALKWKRAMAKAGLPWNSLDAIAEFRKKKESEVKPTDINAVKKQKLEREVRRLDIRIAEDERRLVCREQMRQDAIRAAAVWCSELDALVSDLPGQLAGLSEPEILPKLRSRIELLKTNCRTIYADLARRGMEPKEGEHGA